MTTLNTIDALKQFDSLVEQGELFYTPSKPIILRDDGLDFDLRTIPSFASKPLPSSTSTAQSSHRPPPTDGSDIDHADPAFFVAQIHNTHKLILNKFCVFRPQYLLLTLDPLRRQTERLGEKDVCAAWSVLRELNKGMNRDDSKKYEGAAGRERKGYYAIYNSGIPGGSSRKHKHMQLMPLPLSSDGDLELLPYRGEKQMRQLPITAFFTPLDTAALERMDEQEAGRTVARVVEKQWRRARNVLAARRTAEHAQPKAEASQTNGTNEDEVDEVDEVDETNTPHNVLLTSSFVLTIPRVAATLPENALTGHVVGCQGVLGSVWCSKQEQVEAWRRVGLKRVLRGLGVEGGVVIV